MDEHSHKIKWMEMKENERKWKKMNPRNMAEWWLWTKIMKKYIRYIKNKK